MRETADRDSSYPILHFLILALSFSSLLLSCGARGEKSKPDDFSFGLANRDIQIQEGLKYLEEGKTEEAIRFFESLGRRNPHHCGYLIGLPLSQIQKYLKGINTAINFLISVYSGVANISSSQKSPPLISTRSFEYCEYTLDNLVRTFTKDLHLDMKMGVELMEKAMKQGCEMYVNYPLHLSFGQSFSMYLSLNGIVGEVELELLKHIGYWALMISALILAHDLSINTPLVFSYVPKMDTSNVVGTIRTIAFILVGCQRTLFFHPTDKDYIFGIPDFFVRWASSATTFALKLKLRHGKEGYIVLFKDNSGDGIVGYYPERTTPGLALDEIILNVSGRVRTGNKWASVKYISLKIPYIVTTTLIEESIKFLENVRDIVRERRTGCPSNCVSIADFNFFLQVFGAGYLEDSLRVDIMRYFHDPKSLREMVPYWFFNQETERWEFMIEGEVPSSRKVDKYYLFNYDASHFEEPKTINFYGQEISDFAIPPDCVLIGDVPLNWIVSPYLLFQDPSLGGIIYVRIKYTPAQYCSVYEILYDVDEWRPPNQYILNKIIAIISTKVGSVINPLLNLIMSSVEVVSQ